MEMPDSVLLMHLNLRSAFLDRKSQEDGTLVVKPKYKLFTFKKEALGELDILTFHVLTSQKQTYIQEKTIDIIETDWEHREGTHLDGSGKLCSQAVSFMNKETVLLKMRDRDNKFSHVATLGHVKFNEVLTFIQDNLQAVDRRTNFDVKDVIESIINDTQIPESLLQKLGLN